MAEWRRCYASRETKSVSLSPRRHVAAPDSLAVVVELEFVFLFSAQAACDAAAAEIRALGGGEAFGFGVDVGNGAAVAELCERLLGEFGRVDILVNNAGITKDNLFIRMSEQEWHDVINVNLNSAFYFTSPLIKKMIKNKSGDASRGAVSVRLLDWV